MYLSNWGYLISLNSNITTSLIYLFAGNSRIYIFFKLRPLRILTDGLVDLMYVFIHALTENIDCFAASFVVFFSRLIFPTCRHITNNSSNILYHMFNNPGNYLDFINSAVPAFFYVCHYLWWFSEWGLQKIFIASCITENHPTEMKTAKYDFSVSHFKPLCCRTVVLIWYCTSTLWKMPF